MKISSILVNVVIVALTFIVTIALVLYTPLQSVLPGETTTVTTLVTTTHTISVTYTTTLTNTVKIYISYPELYSVYGGLKTMKRDATGYFRVELIDGVYWLVDPEGYLFISKGVNHVDYMGDYSPQLGYSPYYVNILRKYQSIETWIDVTVSRLKRWGFNTLGAWSSRELFMYVPYTVNLNVLGEYGFNWTSGKMPDVFSDKFVEYIEKKALFQCKPLANDSLLLGYFLDNELRFTPDWRTPNHLLDDFMNLPADAPGKRVAVEIIKEVYNNDINELNKELGTNFSSFEELLEYSGKLPDTDRIHQARVKFIEAYLERYLSVTVSTIRKYDPNHLILGIRYAALPFDEYTEAVYRVLGKYVDVVSVNLYNYWIAPRELLWKVYELTKKPIMITEFSFRARDSGLPNTKGAGILVNTQLERANATRDFIVSLLRLPFVVGYHWFQYYDQPKEGRFDGENSNFGLVDINDEPYIEMIKMFTELNTNAEHIHLNAEKIST